MSYCLKRLSILWPAARAAFYKGDERTRTMEVDVDGTLVTTYTSSGESSLFEIIDITGPGRVITVTGVLEPDEWFSILEVSNSSSIDVVGRCLPRHANPEQAGSALFFFSQTRLINPHTARTTGR